MILQKAFNLCNGRARGAGAAGPRNRRLAHLPDDLYPGGAKAGGWTKAMLHKV